MTKPIFLGVLDFLWGKDGNERIVCSTASKGVEKTQWGDSKNSNAVSKCQNWGAVFSKQLVCNGFGTPAGRSEPEEDREFN